MNAIDWEFVVRAAGPFVIFVGIVVSAALVRRQMRLNYDLAIRNKSVGYSLYANEHLRDSRIAIERAFGQMNMRRAAISLEEIEKTKQDSPDVYADILTILSHWENMALSIEFGIADDEVCFEMVGTTLVKHVQIFREFIVDRQESNARAYQYLTIVQRRWSDRLKGWEKKTTPKPLAPN